MFPRTLARGAILTVLIALLLIALAPSNALAQKGGSFKPGVGRAAAEEVVDLAPHAPAGYAAPVVPSSGRDTTTAGSPLYAGKPTYFDWHFAELGGAPAPAEFHVEMRIDGQPFIRQAFSEFAAGQIDGADDTPFTVDAPGWHTVSLVVDADGTIAEADESNNVWEDDFYWAPVEGWWGEFFNNVDLAGEPVLGRASPIIDFSWSGSPGPGVNANEFSVRWNRDVSLAAGTYRFTMTHDDGMRFYFDGVLQFDGWQDEAAENEVVIDGITDGLHTMQVEMVDRSGPAVARFGRERCHSLAVAVSPDAGGAIDLLPPPNCGPGKYVVETVVTLTAVPAPGFSFVNWSGDLSGGEPVETLTINGDRSVAAAFEAHCYPVAAVASPAAGGSVTVAPGPNCGDQYLAGTTITLTAVPSANFDFIDWSGGLSGSANPQSLTVSGAETVTANFKRRCFLLTTQADPADGGTVTATPPPNCAGGKYRAGTAVTLTAIPAATYNFFGWSGDVSGSQNPTSVTMDSARSVTADFSLICYGLTRTISPAGWGSISLSPPPNCAGGRYTIGTSVTLTAVPAVGYAFTAWSGDLSGSANPQSLTMNGRRNVTAAFTDPDAGCFALQLTHGGQGLDPTASPDRSPGCAAGQFKEGAAVQLTASPTGGWHVVRWEGTLDNASTATTNSLTMPASPHTVRVVYELLPAPVYRALLPGVFGVVCYQRTTETDPNNTPAEANGPLCAGQSVRAWPDDNYDYYFFQVTESRQIEIELRNAVVPIHLQLLAGNGVDVLQTVSAAPYTITRPLSPGVYYLRVATRGAYSTSPYFLEWN